MMFFRASLIHILWRVFRSFDKPAMSDEGGNRRSDRTFSGRHLELYDRRTRGSFKEEAAPTESGGKVSLARYSDKDRSFLDTFFEGMDDASTFVCTPQWAQETVWPAFRKNLSKKRKSNTFVDFEGFVSEQFRKKFKSQPHSESASVPDNNSVPQTRSAQSSDDTSPSSHNSTYRKGDAKKKEQKETRMNAEKEKTRQIKELAERGEAVRRSRQKKEEAIENKMLACLQKAKDFFAMKDTQELASSVVIFQAQYEVAKQFFFKAKRLKLLLSKYADKACCFEAISNLYKFMEDVVMKCSTCGEDWVTTFYDKKMVHACGLSEYSDNSDGNDDSDNSDENCMMDDDDHVRQSEHQTSTERKKIVRRLHTSQKQLSTQIVKLASHMLKYPLESARDGHTETCVVDEEEVNKCDSEIADLSKKLIEAIRRRSKMQSVEKETSKCLSLTFGTTPNDGTYQIHHNADRDVLLHSIFEAKYASTSDEVTFNVQAGMTTRKSFRSINRNLSNK